jgi:hypothetical protein
MKWQLFVLSQHGLTPMSSAYISYFLVRGNGQQGLGLLAERASFHRLKGVEETSSCCKHRGASQPRSGSFEIGMRFLVCSAF